MKVFCKNSYYGFEKGKYYEIKSVKLNDFIIIESNEDISNSWYKFRLNSVLNEADFNDYFSNIQKERKNKLNHLYIIYNFYI